MPGCLRRAPNETGGLGSAWEGWRMAPPLTIRPLTADDIPTVTGWARQEGFTPGVGDVAIYRATDRQGVWVGWLGPEPVGCIAGVRYSAAYGFIGLFLVAPKQRGNGYGVQLWRHLISEEAPQGGVYAQDEVHNCIQQPLFLQQDKIGQNVDLPGTKRLPCIALSTSQK